MKLNLHIEELAISGLPIGAHDGPIVRDAVARELTRLFGAGALPELQSARRLVLDRLTLQPDQGPEGVGASFANALHAGLTGAPRGPNRGGTSSP
jgi:hypothetical protein